MGIVIVIVCIDIRTNRMMYKLFEVTCPKCGAILAVYENNSVGMAGCYEREEANCPICNTVVGSKRTDGVLTAELLST